MATITLKGLPDDLYERIRKRAAEHRRSINSEIIFCLERIFQPRRMEPASFLSQVDRLRRKTRISPLTDEILRAAKEEGRP